MSDDKVVQLRPLKNAGEEHSPNAKPYHTDGTGQHLAGKARCLSCKHEWDGEAPVGRPDGMTCPACGLNRGCMIELVLPVVGETVWNCPCGGDIFYITREWCRCINCGATQSFNKA